MIGKTFVETPGKQALTKSQIAEQKFILREFFKYAKMAEQLLYVTQGTNFDTASFNDPFLIFKKLYQLDKGRNTVFASRVGGKTLPAADAILENSFLGKLRDGIIDVRQALSEILLSDRKGTIRETVQDVLKPYVEMNDRDFVKTSQRVVATLFDWATQTQKGWNNDIQNVLISKDKNVARRVNDFATSVKKDDTHPLYNNHIIKILTPDFADGEQEVNNLKIKNKTNKVYDQNQIIYAFKELKNYLKSEGNEALYDDMVKLAVLQSGLTQSTVSFTNLLPYEDFLNVYNDVLADLPFMSLKAFKDLNVFERTFWNYDDVVPHMEAEYRIDWQTGFPEYNTNMMFSPEVYNAMKAKDLPILLKIPTLSKEAKYDVIVYTYEKQISPKQKREMRDRGDYSYVNKGLFKKVGLVDNGNNNLTFVYKAINAWGDGVFAKEFYNIPQKSVIDNGFNESDETITNDKILSYFRTASEIFEKEEIVAPEEKVIETPVVETPVIEGDTMPVIYKDKQKRIRIDYPKVITTEIEGANFKFNSIDLIKASQVKFDGSRIAEEDALMRDYPEAINDKYGEAASKYVEYNDIEISIPEAEFLRDNPKFANELVDAYFADEEAEGMNFQEYAQYILNTNERLVDTGQLKLFTGFDSSKAFTEEQKQKIFANFASKHSMNIERAKEYINDSFASQPEETISKLKECYL